MVVDAPSEGSSLAFVDERSEETEARLMPNGSLYREMFIECQSALLGEQWLRLSNVLCLMAVGFGHRDESSVSRFEQYLLRFSLQEGSRVPWRKSHRSRVRIS